MYKYLLTASAVCLLASPALAQHKPLFESHHPKQVNHHPHHHHTPAPQPQSAPQPITVAPTATATGTGVGIAKSNSESKAVAVSGQGGAGGNVTINSTTPSHTTSTSTVNQNVSGSTTQNVNSRVSGTTTVKSAPSMVAPGLTAAGLETCLGSASGTVSAVGFGIGGGSTYKDEDCTARLDSRTLFAMGLKAAAVARLCQRADIWRSMPDICQQYWPAGVPVPYGVAVGYPEGYVAPPRNHVSVLMKAADSSAARMGGSSIEVIDGKTGLTRPCDDYNAVRQKCLNWADAPKKQKLASTPKPKKSVVAAAATVTPAPAPAAVEPKKEND